MEEGYLGSAQLLLETGLGGGLAGTENRSLAGGGTIVL